MSPDTNSDGAGDYDPTLTFSTDKYEGNYALSISYSFPSGQWCGYWSYANDIDPAAQPNSTIDVSGYNELRMYARGTSGNEQMKIEINSSSSEVSYTYVTVPGTSWGEIVVPLSSFSKVPWVAAPVDLSRLRQINIVFDRSPYSSTVYLDYIRFTGGTSALQNPTASFTYSPASPRAGDSITFNASGSSDEDGTIVSYSWNFGDGTTGSGVTTSHTYQTSGNYNVTLTVTDNDGLSSGLTRTISVGQRIENTGNQENMGDQGGAEGGTEEGVEGGSGGSQGGATGDNIYAGGSDSTNGTVIVPGGMTIMGVFIVGAIASVIAYIIRKRNKATINSGWA
ncbi:MAG: PKD domain-containing protein [Candidatus Hadarchaeales archaeon]